MSDQPKPSKGRIVLFHYYDGRDWQECPAIVTSVCNDVGTTVNLHAFHDADEEVVFQNDKRAGVPLAPAEDTEAWALWRANTRGPSRDPEVGCCWSWPPRV